MYINLYPFIFTAFTIFNAIKYRIQSAVILIKTLSFKLIRILIFVMCASKAHANAIDSSASLDTSTSLAKIAIIVNNQAISTLDITRRIAISKQAFIQSNTTIPNDTELKQYVIKQLIDEKLLLSIAQENKLIPDDKTVDQTIMHYANEAGLSKTEFLNRIVESGLSIDEYTQEIKYSIAMESVREKQVFQAIKISESDIDRFLSSPESDISIEYTPLALFIPKPESNNTDTNINTDSLLLIKKQADALYKSALKAKDSTDFLILQPKLPTGNTHKPELGTRTLDKFPNLFAQALKTMNVGDTSKILEGSSGFFILRLQNKQIVLPKVAQNLVRHILLKVPTTHFNKDKETSIYNTITDIYNQLLFDPNLFTELAKSFSEDSSSIKGGDLGWVLTGDLVPEFEQVMHSLNLNAISKPFRSQLGWHIVQVIDKQTVELPLQRLRNQARNILYEKNQKQAYIDWLNQLNAQAYIEYKIKDIQP